MSKWIISWDVGYGDEYLEVEADSYDSASEKAYQMWKEEAEQYARYEAVPYTDELAEDYDL